MHNKDWKRSRSSTACAPEARAHHSIRHTTSGPATRLRSFVLRASCFVLFTICQRVGPRRVPGKCANGIVVTSPMHTHTKKNTLITMLMGLLMTAMKNAGVFAGAQRHNVMLDTRGCAPCLFGNPSRISFALQLEMVVIFINFGRSTRFCEANLIYHIVSPTATTACENSPHMHHSEGSTTISGVFSML